MVQKYRSDPKKDAVTVRMDITVGLPAEMAEKVERLGIDEFERCVYDAETHQMILTATTTFYGEEAHL